MNKVLLFDFDGTIANSFESFIEIFRKLSMKYHLPPLSREELENLRSEEPKTILKILKIPFYKIPFIGRDIKKMQQLEITKIQPFDDIPEVLLQLKEAEYKLGILTSNSKENVKFFIENNNINIFDYLYSNSSIFGKDKLFLQFLKQNAISKEEVIYIGDEIRDIQACQKVGIKIVAVTWGFNSKKGLAKYHPDFLIDKPIELIKLLESNYI